MNLTPIRTYGRTKSRTLKPAQATLLDDLLPRLAVPTSPFDPRQLLPAVREVWIEIGFGGGEHLAAQAAAHPDVLVLGAEPFLNGVASALRHIDAGDLGNVRLRLGDGRELLALLPEGSVDRLFILFPDPWPKARHHKRRLINAAFAAEASRVMAPGARLRFATDWADYAHEALAALTACPALAWTAERADDWRRGPADHFVTRYETKRLGDCAPIWLEFERRP